MLYAAVLLGLPLLAVVALKFLVNPAQLAPVISAQLSAALRRQVALGEVRFSVLPLRLQAAELVIGDDSTFSSGSFLTTKSLEIHPQLWPLLRGELVVDSLVFRDPRVELIQNANGVWNFSTLGKESAGAGEPFRIWRLAIENAVLGVRRAEASRQEYSNLSLELLDYTEGKPFGMKVAARMPSGELVAVQGTVESAGKRVALRDTSFALAAVKGTLAGTLEDRALDFRLQVPRAALADLAPLFLPKGMTAKGQVAADVTAKGSIDRPELRGKVELMDVELSGGDVKQPVKTPRLALEFTPERMMLAPADLSSGSTHLQAFGVLAQYAGDAPLLEATVIAPNAEAAELLAIAKAYGVNVAGVSATGKVSLQARAHGRLVKGGRLEFAGKGSVKNLSLKTPSLAQPLRVRTANVTFEETGGAVRDIDASIGGTSLAGDLTVRGVVRPSIQIRMRADRLNMEEAKNWITETKPGTGGKPASFQVKGSVAIGELRLAELMMTQVSAEVDGDAASILLDPLNCTLYSGSHTGRLQIVLANEKREVKLWSRLERVESGQLLAAVSAVKGIVSGPLSANVNLSFIPGEASALARSLNGELALKLDGGRLAGLNLTREMGTIAKFLGVDLGNENFTQLLGVSGDLAIRNGLASTQNLKLDLANLSAGLTGSMNFADQTLNLKLLSVLDRKFSERVGGNKVGGFMNAVFANPQGNLLIPASITGTFSRPIVAPDPGAAAKLKLQGMDPRNPKQVMDNVNNVIDIFRRKK
jgi:uncharacterized protein involved in outer membrane biogenesis